MHILAQVTLERSIKPSEVKDPLVSVVIPSYNYARFLPDALDSVLHQSIQNFEIIVVDDGSQDESLQILAKYVQLYPHKIRVLTHQNQANRGLVATLGLALKNVRGVYIAFLDADDKWAPENLQRKLDFFERFQSVGVVYSSYHAYGDLSGSLYWRFYAFTKQFFAKRRQPMQMFSKFLYSNPIASFTHFMVRRECLDGIPPLNHLEINYDWWILSHLSAKTRFCFVPEKLTYWRIHSESTWNQKLNRRILYRLFLFQRLLCESLLQLESSLRITPKIRSIVRAKDTIVQSRILFQAHRPWRKLKFLCRHPIHTLFFCFNLLLRNLLLGRTPREK